ncbi:MAG: DUF493 family protein [Gammaproteobacteria bacterium]|nr:DUF493 family protein [Gammaproteobacteria bacterium]
MSDNDQPEPEGFVYPTVIDIKVFARYQEGVRDIVKNVVLTVLDSKDFHGITTKQSSKGNYQSLSCKVTANSKEEMDDVFQRLSSHPEIMMVL